MDRVRHLASKRRAISPIIATVLIIAVTLIASVAIGGFVFGTTASGENTAQVAVVGITIPASVDLGPSIVTCSPNNGNTFGGYIQLYNSGTAATSANSLIFNYGGSAYTVAPSGSCIVAPETSLYLLIISLPIPSTAMTGDPYSGYVSTGNGAEVLFVGTFN